MTSRPRRALVPMLALGLLVGVAACSGGSTPSTSAPTVVAAGAAGAASTSTAPTNGSTVDVATFAAALSQPGVTLLDVRTAAEFASGHLEGAQNLDVNSADFATTLATLPKDAVYAVYCHSGNRSGTAVAKMVDQGFTHVFHLGGGITAWQAAGQPVVQ